MTEKELIKFVADNQAQRYSMLDEITRLKELSDRTVREFISENAKFKVGNEVNIVTEKYKTPRKYIVQRVWGFIETQNDNTKSVSIRYDLVTINGHRPNGGWSLTESQLKLAE